MKKQEGQYFITDSGEPLSSNQGNRYGVWIKKDGIVNIVDTGDDLSYLIEKYDVPDERVIPYRHQPNK